jgi:hypothetical protein
VVTAQYPGSVHREKRRKHHFPQTTEKNVQDNRQESTGWTNVLVVQVISTLERMVMNNLEQMVNQ